MVPFLIVVHVFVCLVLVAVILLQAGRGGGLSDIAGSQPQSILGTQTNAFMTRATEVCAVVFIVTSLSLGILSARQGKSLMERNRVVDALKGAAAPAAVTAPPAEPVKAEAPAAAESAAKPAETAS
jgi:preprotein translocase subunit SecG